MAELKPGMLLAEGERRHKILAVHSETVEYLDWYPGPPVETIQRQSSRICFEIGLKSGAVVEVRSKKGGAA